MKSKFINNGETDEFQLYSKNKYSNAFTTPSKDLIDDYTLALLHFDDSSNIAKDECEKNNWTAVGNPTISTTNAKFRKGLQLDNKQYLQLNNGITLGGEDFTIDFWAYMTNKSVSGIYKRFFEFVQTAGNDATGVILTYWNNNVLRVKVIGSGDKLSSSVTYLNTLCHYALVYQHSLSKFTLYLNGKSCLSFTQQFNKVSMPYAYIGRYSGDTGYGFSGTIDEFRISNIARWIENFVPPTEPYSDNSSILIPSYSNMTKVIN